MRNVYLLVCFSFFTIGSMAQKEDEEYLSSAKGPGCKALHFGLSLGFNNHGIVAGQVEYITKSGFAVDFNIGLGGWLIKQSVDFKYYFGECGEGWQIGAGLSYCANNGQGQMKLLVLDSLGVEKNDGVTIRLYPLTSVKVFGARYWNLGEKTRFFLKLGFESRLTKRPYEIVSNHVLASSSKWALELYAGGGLLTAIGFSF